ncbi:MAG: B12-binding domain-containing radical SAM protein [Candidatus Omnitrophica bacterium]|nr:B12-binding domain-containing radical SAM protein [Candidatus Omnitrophota bacterium]
MKIRLVLADLCGTRGISVRYLSSYAKSKGIETKLLFPLIPKGSFKKLARLTDLQKEQVLSFLQTYQITHFGCYLMTGQFLAFKELVIYLRKAGWKGCIIAGGIHASVRPEETLFEGVDYAVIGPGEQSLVDIIQGKQDKEIRGLVYRSADSIELNKISKEAYIPMDILPFPDYDLEDHFIIDAESVKQMTPSLYQQVSFWRGRYYYLTTTRGCVYRCSYCCNFDKDKVRRASVDRVMEELHYAKKKLPFLFGVNVQDDSFFMGSDEWLREFSARYKKEFGWPFIIRITPKFVTEERIKMLKDCGLNYVSLGLQGSDRINADFYNRHIAAGDFLKACRILSKMRMFFVVDIILDVVYETEDDIREIARTINQLSRPFKVMAFSMTPFPGTAFYDRVVKDGLLDKFGADAYESMFTTSRPGAYKTPLYWRNLISKIIPLCEGPHIDKLIESSPSDKESAAQVEMLYKKCQTNLKRANWLRQTFPALFTPLLKIYTFIKHLVPARSSK